MTMRRWMVAVAVVAFAIAAAWIGNQWLAYRQKAIYHADVAKRGSILFDNFYSKYAN
jgi:DNA-binding transcriptional regulator of glucitol operon